MKIINKSCFVIGSFRFLYNLSSFMILICDNNCDFMIIYPSNKMRLVHTTKRFRPRQHTKYKN